jgi:Ser/Thr protein kinase RdoA (MazF antagonist)
MTRISSICWIGFGSPPAEQILAELDFLSYLLAQSYPANRAVLSRAGRELEIVDTSDGRYLAVVFAGVTGRHLVPATRINCACLARRRPRPRPASSVMR